MSKAESSSFALVETPFSLREIVHDVVSPFEANARAKGLQLRASLDDGVPATMIGDPVAMRQILTNLVANAVKFTERGAVEVRVRGSTFPSSSALRCRTRRGRPDPRPRFS